MILVTGATGSIGRALCQNLVHQNVALRALCRRPAQVHELIASGIPAVLGDLEDPASVALALEGCTKLLLLTAATPGQSEREVLAIDTAVRRGNESYRPWCLRSVLLPRLAACHGRPSHAITWPSSTRAAVPADDLAADRLYAEYGGIRRAPSSSADAVARVLARSRSVSIDARDVLIGSVALAWDSGS